MIRERLTAKLVDKQGRRLGYRTQHGVMKSLASLVQEVNTEQRTDLDVFVRQGRQHVRRPANDTISDNLGELQELEVEDDQLV